MVLFFSNNHRSLYRPSNYNDNSSLSTLSDNELIEQLASFRHNSQFSSDLEAGLFFMIPLTAFFTILGYKIGTRKELLEWMPIRMYAPRAVPRIVTASGMLIGLGIGTSSLIELAREADLDSNGKVSESWNMVNILRQRGRSMWSVWRETKDKHKQALIKKLAQEPIDPSDLTVRVPVEKPGLAK